MSIQDDLRKEGIKLTSDQKRQLRLIVARKQKERRKLLAALRKFIETHADSKTGRLKTAYEKKQYALILDRISELDKRIFRLGGKTKKIDYEEFS